MLSVVVSVVVVVIVIASVSVVIHIRRTYTAAPPSGHDCLVYPGEF